MTLHLTRLALQCVQACLARRRWASRGGMVPWRIKREAVEVGGRRKRFRAYRRCE